MKRLIVFLIVALIAIALLECVVVVRIVREMRGVKQSWIHARALENATLAYWESHTNRLPETIDVLIEEGLIKPEMVQSPFAPDATDGFMLVAAELDEMTPFSETMLFVQKGQSRRGIQFVGYADGSVRKRQSFQWLRERYEKHGDIRAAYDLAVDQYNGLVTVRDYERALELFRVAAYTNAAARNYIGIIYDEGLGVDPDHTKAFQYFLSAAEGGNVPAMFNVGRAYEAGKGVDENVAEAASWYLKAAREGHERAMVKIGLLYLEGQGVKRDPIRSLAWLRKAARSGDAQAIADLGSIYQEGALLSRDAADAMKFYRAAADAGSGRAAAALGWMYETGQGVAAKEQAEAQRWYEKAAELGEHTAGSTRTP